MTYSPPPAFSSSPSAALPPQRPERFGRGVLLALIVVPVGIVATVLVSEGGYIAVIVGLLISAGAHGLYRVGSGGRVSMRGAIAASLIAIVTVVLGVLIAAADTAFKIYGTQHGLNLTGALADPGYLASVGRALGRPEFLFALLIGIGAAVVVGFRAMRSAQAASQVEAPSVQQDH